MRKNAFTLIELIGVVVVLGIVLLAIVPINNMVLKNSKEKLYEAQISEIRDSLKNWAIDNNRILPTVENQSIVITLSQLKIGGYIKNELINPKTDKCLDNNTLLTITRYKKNYIYEVDSNEGTETNKCSNSYIVLNDNPIIYVEVNSSFVDPGALAQDSNGNNISDSITTQISGSDTSIDTSIVGNKYVITYTIVENNIATSIKRNVIIVDSSN